MSTESDHLSLLQVPSVNQLVPVPASSTKVFLQLKMGLGFTKSTLGRAKVVHEYVVVKTQTRMRGYRGKTIMIRFLVVDAMKIAKIIFLPDTMPYRQLPSLVF
ncbi:uncharacterized protein PHALS_11285 [Plasmopara halstedii]|uniref:Uncharacterized protein n=1 Tax=Plasmopara halstedii TaxID=4781 RepID=A0A0P1AJI0_PLAHL|nr:uncharacterized protein PHALS_11285 [Plasmopara halstedii]CEG41120.1 hypothetical protein PHALS_11285 [Plasmopara halstedii]|eukprot:XP_024577489.1 hypothetical protein PHALS_11285 [Plasmopara halstedii]